MFIGSCLKEYVIALLTFVAGDGIGKDDFVGVTDMGFAGCVGDGGGDVVFLFFHGLLSPFLNVDAPSQCDPARRAFLCYRNITE